MDFNTSNKDLRSILGNGVNYSVPRFQRDYSWGEGEWRDLWDDIDASTGEALEKHYMGYLVLQRKGPDEKGFLVIDGQQRLTTISLLIIAGLRHLNSSSFPDESEDSRVKRMETIRSSYIGTMDSVSLLPSNKLILNRNNDSYYKRISKLESPPIRKTKASEKLLWKACEYFHREIAKRCQNGAEIAVLLDRMASRLFFTEIIVDDELNAYRVFETLNARGVQLSTPDLLKNYLFSQIAARTPDDRELDALDVVWSSITTQLGNHSFARFVLADWNRNHSLVRKGELFRRIKNSIRSPAEAAQYVSNLETNSEIYAALHEPDDEFWNEKPSGVRKSLRTLKVFGITQPMGLLMSVFEHLPDDFERILRWIATISIRWNVLSDRSTQFQEGIYNKASRSVCEGNGLMPLAASLRELYPSDEDVQEVCVTKKFESKQSHRGARYILARVEEKLNSFETPIQESDLTLEHFMPQSASEEWVSDEHDEEIIENYTYRLGNLTLLSASGNRDAANLGPVAKRELLKDSQLKVNQLFVDRDWSLELVESRGRWLGKQITSVWRIDFP